MSQKSWKSEIDDLIRRTSPGNYEELIEYLDPEGTWPDIEKVLYLTSHDQLEPAIQKGALPEQLEEALTECFQALLPMLGTRGYGPLHNHIEKARRTFRTEREKFTRTIDALDNTDDEEGRATLVYRYLDTSPGPLFSSKMRSRHPDLVEKVDAKLQRAEKQDAFFTPPDVLLNSVKSPDEDRLSQHKKALDDYLDENPLGDSRMKKALEKGSDDDALLVASIALHQNEKQYGPLILDRVFLDPPNVIELAVIAAQLVPNVTRNILSQYVAEASLTDPEKPEASIFAGRARAVLTARTVLAYVDTPLEKVTEDEVPDDADEELFDVPSEVDKLWNYLRDFKARLSGDSDTESDG